MSTPPTATPRTQALWMKHHAFSTEEEATEALCDLRDHGNLLETELAAAKGECERLKFATEGHLLKTIQQQAELARLRAELAKIYSLVAPHGCDLPNGIWETARVASDLIARAEIAENWSDHHASHADDLIAENVKLRADLERFTGHGLLDCHAICDQRDAAVAERDRLRAELSAVQAQHLHEVDELAAQAKIMNALRAEVERLKDGGVQRIKDALATALDTRDAAIARAEKAEKLWKEFITLMDITEESDSGNAFNPNKISSCRAMDGKRLNEILIEARQIVF